MSKTLEKNMEVKHKTNVEDLFQKFLFSGSAIADNSVRQLPGSWLVGAQGIHSTFYTRSPLPVRLRWFLQKEDFKMGMTQEQILEAVAKDRAVVISQLSDLTKLRWLPSYKYDGTDALSRIQKHINEGTISELSINLIEDGIQLIAFHHNTGIPVGKYLVFPFNVGEFEDSLDALDRECSECEEEIN